MLTVNWSFHKKIFTGMIVATLVPMLIGYLAMIQVFNHTYEKNLQEEAQKTLKAVSASIEVGFDNIYEAIGALSSNEVIVEMLKSDDEQNDFMAYRELYAITLAYGDYADYCIYDKNGMLRTSMDKNKYIKEKLPLDWSALYESTREPEKFIVRNAKIYSGADKEEFLRVAKAVVDGQGEIRGYIVGSVLNSHFEYILKGAGIEKSGIIYAMDDFHEIVYTSTQDINMEEFREIRQELLSDTTLNGINKEDDAYYHTYIENHGMHIFFRQPIGTLELLKNNLISIAVMTGIISLLICLLLSGSFSNVFYKPVKQMQEAIARIREGDFTAKVKVYSNDELGQLSQSVNVMTEHLTDNMNRLVLRERELSEANIKMMQAQLNPHFIYNTLDTMKWIGKANQLPEVAILSSGLAQILRASISAGQTVTLRQETELVEAYVEIQKIRFEDKFEFLMDISEELMEAKVPKLILQPIVENAILHGFEGRAYGSILLQAKLAEEENRLLIFVQDDGVGMEKETLERLNRHVPPEVAENQELDFKKKMNSSIGFYNVNEIIRLNYEGDYGLHVESVPGEGTMVRYELPYYV